ncbi:AMP-binding protein [Butyrivibrio sp. MC2013]|uniref:AMP-binding protein n=1 Tax=Butyrivibrio sp. MC2013 TaxID=1280686 RepID=UPI00041B69CF|nr:AMP-binding protein [Butyrivibrio sp. MC2013]
MGFIEKIDNALRTYADTPCLTDKDATRTISYKEFNALSGKAAVKLMSMGIRKKDAVIIRLGRSYEYLAAEYGAVRIGATAIPVIPSYPEARVEYIKKDADAKLILGDDFFDDIDKYEFDPDKADVDSFDADKGEEAPELKRFIFYTSGSTGNPKGVIYRDRAVTAAIVRNVEDTAPNKVHVVYASAAPLSFTVTIAEYFKNMAVGSHVHMLSEDTRKDVGKVQDYYADNNITVGFLAPRMLKVYKNKDKALKSVMTGSEKVVNVYSDDYRIVNKYGQTETIGCVCKFVLDKAYDNTPVGKPIYGITVKIMDDDGNELPRGEEGNIIIYGDLPYEYNNLPEQTAKTFKKIEDGLVAVKTGDVGRFLPDGNILFGNRHDWMLKLHGQRVEPGEIESVMNSVEGVTGSIVKAFENEDGTMLLCGFYTENKPVDKAVLKKGVEARLPHYMIPGIFVKMDAFPVNVNGKIDRKSIGRPDLNQLTADYEEPVGDVEAAIAAAMQKVLKIKRVGRNDNFFELGGNSINAVALCTECGIKGISARDIMMGATPRLIAEEIKKNASFVKPDIKGADESQTEFEMTNAQKYQVNECAKINTPLDINDFRGYWKLPQGIDIRKLMDVVNGYFADSPGLNVSFDSKSGKMYRTDRKPHMEEIDIEPSEFEKFRRQRAAVRRDLTKDELYEIAILHVGSDDYLYINLNHLIYDESSIKNMINDIEAGYEGRERSAENVDIFDLSVYEQDIRSSDYYKKAIEYHEKLYNAVTPDNLPAKGEKQDKVYFKKVAPELDRKKVENFLKERGVSEIIYLQAAFALTMHKKLIKTEKLTNMTIYNGRVDPSYRSIRGVLAQALYMYTDLDPDKSIDQLLSEIQDTYQNLSYYGGIDIVEMSDRYPNIKNDIYMNFRASMDLNIRLGGLECVYKDIGFYFDDAHIWTRLNMLVDHTADKHYQVSAASGFYDTDILKAIIDEFEKMLIGLLDAGKVADLL